MACVELNQDNLKEVMDKYGYNIIGALVNDIDPDARVKEAMNEINAAQRMRKAAEEKGEAEKILMVKKAEAEGEKLRNRAMMGVGGSTIVALEAANDRGEHRGAARVGGNAISREPYTFENARDGQNVFAPTLRYVA